MDRLKTFGMYILIIIAIYIFVSFASYGFIIKAYKSVGDYEILTSTPKIEIVDAQATYVNGFVVARVTNNTGAKIDKTYLKLDLYTENDNYLGTKYSEITDFIDKEVVEVKTNFRFYGVENYKVSVVDSIVPGTLYDDRDQLRNGLLKLIGLSGVILFIYYVF